MMLTLADSPASCTGCAHTISPVTRCTAARSLPRSPRPSRTAKTFPFTSGSNLYDFIDVDELANMIVAASVQEEINGIINVCTGKPMSLADRVEQFLRDKNYKIKLDYGAFPDRPYDSPGTWGDLTKINRILANDTCKRA